MFHLGDLKTMEGYMGHNILPPDQPTKHQPTVWWLKFPPAPLHYKMQN